MTNNKQLRERLRQTTLAIGIKLGYLNPNDLDSQLKGKMYTELENINNILVDLLDSVREESDEEVRKQVLRARKAERKLEEYKGMIEAELEKYKVLDNPVAIRNNQVYQGLSPFNEYVHNKDIGYKKCLEWILNEVLKKI